MEYLNSSIYSPDYFGKSDFWLFNFKINNYPVAMIFYNILLLAVPFYLAKLIGNILASKKKDPLTYIILILAILLWFLFIPNAAYIIVDVRHLMNYCPVGSPYNTCVENTWLIMFFFFYACIGWVSFYYLVNQMRIIIEKYINKITAKLYIVVIIPLISLGILLGLLGRWNSWDIFIFPARIFSNLFMFISDYYYFRNWLVFTIFLYTFYYLGNLIFKSKIKIK